MDKFVPHKDYATVGDLLKFIEKNNIPMDAPILMQRVTDWYFTKGSWKTHKKNGFGVWQNKQHNMKMLAELWKRNSGGEPDYPGIDDPFKHMVSEEEMSEDMEEYYAAWCPVFYKDEPNVLFLDAHY